MEEQVQTQRPKADHSLNIKEIFFKYVRFLPLYILCVALSLFGAYLYLRYATEIYRAGGQLIIRDEKTASSSSDLVEQAIKSDGRKNIQTETEVLQSRPLMERTVKALNLNYNYYSTGKIKELNIYKTSPFRLQTESLKDSNRGFTFNLSFPNQQTFTVNGSAPLKFGQVFQNEFGKFRMVRVTENPIAEQGKIVYNPTSAQAGMLLGGLVVVPKPNTGILSIYMESANPHLSADVVNVLMQQYEEMTIEEKNAATLKSLNFIDANLRKQEIQLDSIARQLVSYQKARNIVEPQMQASGYFGRVEEAQKMEQDQRIQLNNAVQLQDYLRSNAQGIVPSSLGINDPTLNTLIGSYNQAQAERKELLENAQPGHVIVQQKTEEISSLRRKILENVKNIGTSYSSAIGQLRSTSSAAAAQIKALPDKRQDLEDIRNRWEGKMKLYNDLLSKREVSAITLASTISNTKVMQGAMPNATPVKPDRRNIRIIAFFIGLLIPSLIIVILELMNDKINSKSDIERLTNATILGEVGHNNAKQTLVVTTGNRKVIAEQFRILRSNLQFVLTKAPKPVIMVTSSFSGEGKSFISTNIGAVMALANKRTIILEFDIRKPKVVSGLDLQRGPGLTNFILGEATLDQLPMKVPGYDNLFVLPCGPIPPNPSELLLDTKLDELFIYLREKFDVVVMDTAPVGMVSDALTLSKYADCTLYIVRQRHTYKKQISLVDTYYNEGKLPKVSIVVNDVQMQAGYGGYGYGGTYGYGYGYGSGYFEEETQNRKGFDRWFGWLGSKNGTAETKKQKAKKV